MTGAGNASQKMLVEAVAARLKERMQQPEWAKFVKTGVSRERAPQQKDWWWMRAASILRKVGEDGPVGVQRLRTYYGGRKRHTHSPAHFRRAGGKIIRTILADLEKQGLIEKTAKPRKGRVLSREGKRLLDKALQRKAI